MIGRRRSYVQLWQCCMGYRGQLLSLKLMCCTLSSQVSKKEECWPWITIFSDAKSIVLSINCSTPPSWDCERVISGLNSAVSSFGSFSCQWIYLGKTISMATMCSVSQGDSKTLILCMFWRRSTGTFSLVNESFYICRLKKKASDSSVLRRGFESQKLTTNRTFLFPITDFLLMSQAFPSRS